MHRCTHILGAIYVREHSHNNVFPRKLMCTWAVINSLLTEIIYLLCARRMASVRERDKLLQIAIEELLTAPDKYTKFKVLVCGKTGVGKSSLVNSLVGYEAFEVGDPGLDIGEEVNNDAFRPMTMQVKAASIKVDGLIVQIWDSPGLQDGTDNDETYLQDMYEKCKDVDLVLYCMEMTTSRWTVSEINATRLLTATFGDTFWQKCVVVLTKANSIWIPPGKRVISEKVYAKRLYGNIRERFSKQLVDQGILKELVQCIPFVAAGWINTSGPVNPERYLWYVSDKADASNLMEKIDFLPELWVTCFERVPGGISQLKFTNATTNRMKRLGYTFQDGEGSNSEMEEIVQQLKEVFTLVDQKLKENNYEELEAFKNYKRELEEAKNVPQIKQANIKLSEKQEGRIMDKLKKDMDGPVKMGTIIGAGIGAVVGGLAGIAGGPAGIIGGGGVGATVGAAIGAGSVLIFKMAIRLKSKRARH